MAFVEPALSPFLGDRIWSQPLDGATVGPDGIPIPVVDKPRQRSSSVRADKRFRSRPRAATVDGSEGPAPQDAAASPGLASGPQSLRRRRSRRNSRSSRRQSTQGPSTNVKQPHLSVVYIENCDQREFDIIMMICDILWERGPSPVGLLGTRLHAKTQDHNLPTHFKEQYGGLKKFVSRWPNLFELHADHRYNPKVGLQGWPQSRFGFKPPTGAPFSQANGGGQGARARRRLANKTFRQAGARGPHGNFGSLPPGFSPHSQTQALARPYTEHGAPYHNSFESLASHERAYALPTTRDRAATYSGTLSPHAAGRFPGGPPSRYPHPDYPRGLDDGEFGAIPPRSLSPPREMQVEVGDPFDDFEFQDYFLSGGRSHAASDPGPRPYVEPSPLDMPPSSGYARRARHAPQELVPPPHGENHADHGNGLRTSPNSQGEKSASPSVGSIVAPGPQKAAPAPAKEGSSSVGVSPSSSPSSRSIDASSSSRDALLRPPHASNATTPASSEASHPHISPRTTPSPTSHARRSNGSTPQPPTAADALRMRAMKMRAGAHHLHTPEFAFSEEIEDYFGDFPATRARSQSYDVAPRHGGAPRPESLRLPPSSAYYTHVTPRTGELHSLAPLPPMTPPYGDPVSYRMNPREAAASARLAHMDRAYGVSGEDKPYEIPVTPMATNSSGAFFPSTQPLPHRGATRPATQSSAASRAKHSGFSLSQMMSNLSVNETKDGAADNAPGATTKKSVIPANVMEGGRARSVSLPAVPANSAPK